MNARGSDLAGLPDRTDGAICLVIATSMCIGAAAVVIAGGTPSVRSYGAAFLCPPAIGMLWIGLDLASGMRLSRTWRRLTGRD